MAVSLCSGGWTNKAKHKKEVPNINMNLKKQRFHKLLLFILLIAVLLMPMQAFAENTGCTVSIPVEVQVKGDTAPSGVAFQVVITPVDSANPMPEQTTVTIKDTGKASFGPISYTVPGDYQYTIHQEKGKQANFTYDQTSYTVTVRVVNGKDGKLQAEIWAVKANETDKVDTIRFENTYAKPNTPTTPTQKPTPKPTTTPQTKPASPKTGDAANPTLWAEVLVFSLIAMVAVIVALYRQKKQYH